LDLFAGLPPVFKRRQRIAVMRNCQKTKQSLRLKLCFSDASNFVMALNSFHLPRFGELHDRFH